MRLILASASPRRRELIRRVTDDYEIVVSAAEEILAASAEETARANSAIKARAVSRTRPGVVLGADTVVSLDGRILGKPADRAEARAMLTALCGRTHEVITGITLTDGVKTVTDSETTRVTFGPIPDDVIGRYVDAGLSDGKAGAYGIQDEEIAGYIAFDGDYDNVVGLPVRLTALRMKEF